MFSKSEETEVVIHHVISAVEAGLAMTIPNPAKQLLIELCCTFRNLGLQHHELISLINVAHEKLHADLEDVLQSFNEVIGEGERLHHYISSRMRATSKIMRRYSKLSSLVHLQEKIKQHLHSAAGAVFFQDQCNQLIDKCYKLIKKLDDMQVKHALEFAGLSKKHSSMIWWRNFAGLSSVVTTACSVLVGLLVAPPIGIALGIGAAALFMGGGVLAGRVHEQEQALAALSNMKSTLGNIQAQTTNIRDHGQKIHEIEVGVKTLCSNTISHGDLEDIIEYFDDLAQVLKRFRTALTDARFHFPAATA